MAFKGCWRRRFADLVIVLTVTICGATGAAAQDGFSVWLEDLKREAAAAGISQATISAALDDLEPNPRVLELDRRQPEFVQTFWSYLDRSLTPERIARGRELLARHRPLLERIRERYGVQPRFLVAFWGLESNYGDHTGGFSVVTALATLAYDERRSAFFRSQLLDALRILDQGHITPASMSGSWAGAMGQLQFMPSTFVNYAVDEDGDGRRDIWSSLPDIFGSAAKFLSSLNWQSGETWGREVRLPAGFALDLASLDVRKPLDEWRTLGVRQADGSPLPTGEMAGSIILPAGHAGPAFLVYRNFRAILVWNRSQYYALAVGLLADRLVGETMILAQRPADDEPLRRAEVEEIQSRLNRLGFDAGDPDGMVGPQTREAIRAFQRSLGLPADAYPTLGLLQRLRQRSE